jgi:hypothetical protein
MMSQRQGEIVLSCIKSLLVESTVCGLLHKLSCAGSEHVGLGLLTVEEAGYH